MLSFEGVVVWVEDDVQKGYNGKPDRSFRRVTVQGGGPGKKPEQFEARVMNGMKIEIGQKVKLPLSARAGKTINGQWVDAPITWTVLE